MLADTSQLVSNTGAWVQAKLAMGAIQANNGYSIQWWNTTVKLQFIRLILPMPLFKVSDSLKRCALNTGNLAIAIANQESKFPLPVQRWLEEYSGALTTNSDQSTRVPEYWFTIHHPWLEEYSGALTTIHGKWPSTLLIHRHLIKPTWS